MRACSLGSTTHRVTALERARRFPGPPALTCVLALALAGCPPHSGVVAFAVTPPLACANSPVSVKWQVQGNAALKAAPAPANWTEQVASQGGLSVPLATDTTFTIVALDANPARGDSYASQSVQIIPQGNERAALASCDASGKCTGTLGIVSGNLVKVAQLSNPSWKSGLKTAPHRVCVTPPSGARTCLEPGASLPLGVPANGTWAFDTTLESGESATPPPQLLVTFDFGCK